ncbi:MAG: hypothetical protein NUV67_05185 [archaeon]|nr:hypothetical protein [archaeon]
MADSKFFSVLRHSFGVFSSRPIFILPKFLVALLYGFAMLAVADVSLDVLFVPELVTLDELFFLLVVTFGINVLDIFVASLYPFMVRQAESGKKVSLVFAAKEAFSRMGSFLPSLLAVELLFLVAAIFFGVVSVAVVFGAISSGLEFEVFFAVLLAVAFIFALLLLGFVFFFYLLYPIVAYEKNSVSHSLSRSVSLSLKNKWGVGKATLLSFLLSVISFALAFLIEAFPSGPQSVLYWAGFLLTRFLVAYVYSYLYVLNPVFYYKYVGGVK